MTGARLTLSQVADRCFRALSPYDLRRHAAAAAARGADRAPIGKDPQDLYHQLTPEQQRGVDAGIADARRRVDRERLEAFDAAAPRERFLSKPVRQSDAEARRAVRREEMRRTRERHRRERSAASVTWPGGRDGDAARDES